MDGGRARTLLKFELKLSSGLGRKKTVGGIYRGTFSPGWWL
jgi:hypothetical protein